MGLLVDGVWKDQWYDTKKSGGKFVRTDASFRHWVTSDGSAGPSGSEGFKAEVGRYHLFVSYACPWAHRTLIFRVLKGLEDMIDVSVVHWIMGENGWTFQKDDAGIVGNKLFDASYMYEVYLKADPSFSGRVTVPVLWDKQQQTIVSNESSEIIRMFNSAFDEVGAKPGDFYPDKMRSEIDALNERVYDTVNNGVYKSGFATKQESYEDAVVPLFDTLEMLETRLADQRFLCGSNPTEADWRLWPTLLRFDAVYVGHFKCNLKRLIDFPNLWAYARDLYQWPGIANTVHMDHAKNHYYQSHETINPTGIVPLGPIVDWDLPHNRI
ncbi:MAG: glutathione S-transferase family protein [Hyphomicrobiales bacterium]